MTEVTEVNHMSLAIRIGDCVCVRGQLNRKGKPKFEPWYAKITGFTAGRAGVLWFYSAQDVHQALEGTDLGMVKDALGEDEYLIGTTPDSIPIESIQDVVLAVDISGLSTVLLGEGDHLYRWRYDPSLVPQKMWAEQWCTDTCPLNRFWMTKDVMWFCVECQFWYHFECCKTEPSKRSYLSLEDFMSMPLLKGGPVGLAGTAPMVFTAAKVIHEMEAKGDMRAVDWKGLLELGLGCSTGVFLKERMREAHGFITAEVQCCKCHKQSV